MIDEVNKNAYDQRRLSDFVVVKYAQNKISENLVTHIYS